MNHVDAFVNTAVRSVFLTNANEMLQCEIEECRNNFGSACIRIEVNLIQVNSAS